uniref:Uncharacterized protein n=1 Tax=Magallana gigas TaxID=29159 RepID=A0A8W8MP93_MAGGI
MSTPLETREMRLHPCPPVPVALRMTTLMSSNDEHPMMNTHVLQPPSHYACSIDGTSVHETSTGEITLTLTAVLIISSVLSFVVLFGMCLCLCFCRRCRGSPPPPGDIEMNYHHLPLSGEGGGDSVVSDMSDVEFHRPKND